MQGQVANFKTFSSTLRPNSSSFQPNWAAAGTAAGADGDSSPTFRRLASDPVHARRVSDPGLPMRPEIRVRDRVVINTNHKKYDGNLVGKEGTVLNITPNGWVKLQVGGEVLDFQMRCLTPLAPRGLPLASSSSAGGAGGLKGAASAGLGAAGGLEGRQLEFHDNLRTDKSSGLFMSGGAWELLLKECITGGLTEGLLMQLGQLPRIKASEGLGSDVDTDKDVGSEATELGGSDMDVF
eukprot:gene4799-5049_t